jgi:hypothetical protein
MTMASAITLTLCTTHGLQTVWHTPREIKDFITGNPDASKVDVMNAVCDRHKWKRTYKPVKDRNALGGYRRDPTYHVLGKHLPMGKFEHIADSIAAYHTARHYHRKKDHYGQN